MVACRINKTFGFEEKMFFVSFLLIQRFGHRSDHYQAQVSKEFTSHYYNFGKVLLTFHFSTHVLTQNFPENFSKNLDPDQRMCICKNDHYS
jgi:hypothetical protein